MKINVIMSDDFFIELGLKQLDELEEEIEELLSYDISGHEEAKMKYNLCRIEKLREKWNELRRSLQ